jgi:GR25 family glycosyltransferase involved in LPS biosynthesis
MERQLDRFGLAGLYTRFPAIDGSTLNASRSTINKGETGCFHSHYRALLTARSRGQFVHILEDDAVLSEHVRPVIEQAIAQNLFDQFDVLFTDTFINLHLGMLKFVKSAFDELPRTRPHMLNDLKVVDLANQSFSCMTSYVVSPKATDRLLALYQQEIALGPRSPVDLFLRGAVNAGQLRAACAFPFVTSIDLSEVKKSTLDETAATTERPAVMVLAALRYSFFVDRDLALANRCIDEARRAANVKSDDHRALIAEALDFVLSDAFKEF